MTGILDSVREVVHDTAAGLIDNEIPTKLSDLVTGTVKAGFGIVEDALTIVKNLTKEKP